MAIFCHWPPDRSTPVLKRRPISWSYPSGSALDHFVGQRAARGVADAGAVVHRVDLADADVLARGQVVAHEVLEDHADVRAQVVQVVVAQVAAIEQDAAFIRVVEPRQQLHQRGLAGAVLADQRQHFAGAQFEIQPAQRPALGAGITEADVLEREARARSAAGSATRSRPDAISGWISKNENRSSRYSACPATCEKPISRPSSSWRSRRKLPARKVRSPMVKSPLTVRHAM